jgi:hypothetical protein
MMDLPEYRHTNLLVGIVALMRTQGLTQLSPVHPTPDGVVVVMHDGIKDKLYRIHMDLINSEIKIEEPMMFEDFMKKIDGKQ